MGQKDSTEKILEAYNDVFCDIVNTLLFNGEEVLKTDELEEQAPRTHYKADGKVRDIERDVAKRWKKEDIYLACIGFENQTDSYKYMPVRLIGYDGAEYRYQLTKIKETHKVYPVVTMVLYFGLDRWSGPMSLKDCLDIPEQFKPYVNDYKMNLFEIAWLTPEQVKLFKSDFRYVADYFVQVRMTGKYVPHDDNGAVEHIQELLQLLSVMTEDNRFEEILNERDGKEVPTSMSSVIDMYIAKGMEKGMEKGAAVERERYAAERRRYDDERARYADEKLKYSKRIAELEAQVAALGGSIAR